MSSHFVSVAALRRVQARRLLQAATLTCCVPRTASTRGRIAARRASAACHRSRSFPERVCRRLRKSCLVALSRLVCVGREADVAVGTRDISCDPWRLTRHASIKGVALELGAALGACLDVRTLVLTALRLKQGARVEHEGVVLEGLCSPGRIRTSNLLITRSPEVSLRRGLSHYLGASLRCRHWALSL